MFYIMLVYNEYSINIFIYLIWNFVRNEVFIYTVTLTAAFVTNLSVKFS